MPSDFKQLLMKLIGERAPGPSPSFSLFHFLLALELINQKPIGRNKLAEELELGEGTARTMIDRLRDSGLVVISKEGCRLTKKGSEIWKEYASVATKVEIEKSELTFANYNFALLIRNVANKVKTGMEQRDAAMIAGAKGATTMLFKNGRLVFPRERKDVSNEFPRASTQMLNLLKPQENDVIIVASGDSRLKAEYGALAAAWTLIED